MNNENYIVVMGYMVNELGLSGNELLVYAIITGFSQTEEQNFTGNLQYLADWTNSTKQGVLKNIKSLLEKKLIIKTERFENGVKFCEYHSTKFNGVLNKVEQGVKQSSIGGIQQSLTNNINKDNIKDNINNISIKEEKTKRFVRPTLEQVKEYFREKNTTIDAEEFLAYYEARNWKDIKDWKRCLTTWELNEKKRQSYRSAQYVSKTNNKIDLSNISNKSENLKDIDLEEDDIIL